LATTSGGGSWLQAGPAAGTTPATLSMSVNPAGLAAGAYTGTITVTAPGASNSPQTITVRLTVTATIAATPSALSFSQIAGGPAPSAQAVSVSSSGGALSFSASVSTNNGSGWLSVSPSAGATPGVLNVFVNGAGLPAGTYTGSITITSAAAANTPQTVPVTLTVTPAVTVPTVTAVMNAASLVPTSVSPGQIISIFGSGIGPATPAQMKVNASGTVDGTLAETRVLFDGTAAPMIYSSATLVSAIAPYAIAGKTSTRLQVEFQGMRSPGLDLPVTDAAPGIFTTGASGRGQGSILNQDFSVNSAGNPAAKGSIIMIYATGEGQTNPPGLDGVITSAVLRTPVQPVAVSIGGQPAEVIYSGSAPGLVAGVIQVNARVPEGIATGDAVPVVLTVGRASSPPGVTMAIR
jgi:uncharacterized protein (TIGR03437 family)